MIAVAGYCRVSTDKADQLNSLQAQQRYFDQYIKRHKGWVLHEIYADEGISGTGTKKRTQFNRMLEAAAAGKFKILLTKEVSRFSRNILDAIAYTRLLKSYDVNVIFLSDGFCTNDPDSELRLAIMGSIAQEESRKTSARVTWGQTRQMERGVVFGRSMLGYQVSGGVLSVAADEAKIVKRIFHQFAEQRQSATQIARGLSEDAVLTHDGNTRWTANGVLRILRNEKYAGDLVQRKTYTPDYLTHEKRINRGEVPKICISQHHEPIVSRELWNQTQLRLKERARIAAAGGGSSEQHLFSGKIQCGLCGATFVARCRYLRDGTRIRRWSCAGAVSGSQTTCKIGQLIRDDDAHSMVMQALASMKLESEQIMKPVLRAAVAARLETSAHSNANSQNSRALAQQRTRHIAAIDAYLAGKLSLEALSRLQLEYERERVNSSSSNIQRDAKFSEHAAGLYLESLLQGQISSDAFYRPLIRRLTVYADRHLELELQQLPMVFHFA